MQTFIIIIIIRILLQLYYIRYLYIVYVYLYCIQFAVFSTHTLILLVSTCLWYTHIHSKCVHKRAATQNIEENLSSAICKLIIKQIIFYYFHYYQYCYCFIMKSYFMLSIINGHSFPF